MPCACRFHSFFTAPPTHLQVLEITHLQVLEIQSACNYSLICASVPLNRYEDTMGELKAENSIIAIFMCPV